MAIVALPKLPVVPKAKVVPSPSSIAAGAGPAYSTARSGIVPWTAPAAPPSSAPASGGTGDFSGFDFGGDLTPQIDPNAYLSQLEGDPMYQGADQAFSAQVGSARQSLADQIRQLVIRGGWDLRSQMPGSLSQYAGDIGQSTIDAANANPLSAKAQLTQQLNQGRSSLDYELAGRGIGNSGAAATGNTQLQNQYDTASYGAMNQLLDAIGQGAGNFANITAQATAARNAAYEAAASRLAQMQAYSMFGQTPGGYSMDTLAKALPYDTRSVLGKAILGTPGFDYAGLSSALKVPTYQDILGSLPGAYR